MVDEQLLACINAHNKLYPDRPIDLDKGLKLRGYTMIQFIKDLQTQLGTKADGSIGQNDKDAFNQLPKFEISNDYEILKIIRWAMWCKGYKGGNINSTIYGDGSFLSGLHQLQKDAGLCPSNDIDFYTLKSIFSMDAYVLIEGTEGDPIIREMQQKMNPITYKYCGISPCDGLPQQKLNTQIFWYIQYLSKNQGDLDGCFGPTTLKNFQELLTSRNKEAVSVLQLLLRCNGYKAKITGQIDEETLKQIRRFKVLMNLDDPMNNDPSHLAVKNRINDELICALIRSCGLRSRPTSCCDTSYIITQKVADALKNANYHIVGRYISGTVDNRSKALTIEEIALIRRNNFELFLIFQEGARSVKYFKNADQGKIDGERINKAMEALNIPHGNTIFVAVDCDLYKSTFIEYVVPYFTQINKIVTNYRIGVYSTREGCRVLKSMSLASGFFVAGASHAYSGNFGPIPSFWHFEQFRTDIKIIGIDIDKVAVSLNYKECIINFNESINDNDYTELIMEKLHQIEEQIKENRSRDDIFVLSSFLVSLVVPVLNPIFTFSVSYITSFVNELFWFYNQVNHGGPWDLKVDESWKNTISSERMPVFGFPGHTEYFFFQGKYITREELGNITYGYIGTAMGYTDVVLYLFGGLAAHADNKFDMVKNFLMHRKMYASPYFGDSQEDHMNIEFGIELYNRLHQ